MLSTPSGLTVLSGYRALSLKTDRSVLILKDTSQRDTPLGRLAVLTGKGAKMSEEDNEYHQPQEAAFAQGRQPVTSAQVYAVVMHHPDTFVKAEGRIIS